MSEVRLRPVEDADLDTFFGYQQDPLATWMVAFTSDDSADRAAFVQRWARLRSDPQITCRAVVEDGEVAGYVIALPRCGVTDVTGWIDRARWGRHVATRALTALVEQVTDRPLQARVAADNAGAIAVLRHCGFTRAGSQARYADGRHELTEELRLELR